MAEKKLTLKQALAALWQQAEDTFATQTDVGKVSSFAYGVSATAVGTAAKVITLQGVTGWTLKDGAIIAVSFTNGTNTANNPTFNVNETGAKRVKYNGSQIGSTNKDFAGTSLVQFYYYDGTNWVWFFRDYGQAEDEVVNGYYYQGKFYKESTHTTEFVGESDKLYLDLGSAKLYVATGQSSFRQVGGTLDVNYDTTNHKITKTNDGTTTDVVTAATIVSDGGAVTNVSYDSTNKKVVQTKGGSNSDVLTRANAQDLVGRGENSGVASLDSSGKIPTSQLPSYVSDVLEYANQAAFPATGEASKIYVAKDTNLTYRWGGSSYVEISPSIALGETSSTAYAGDKGKANADKLLTIESGAKDNIKLGYYKAADKLFYATKNGSTYSDAIAGEAGKLYFDQTNSKYYYFNGSTFSLLTEPGSQVNVLEGVKDSSGTDLTITNKKVQLSKAAVGLGNVTNDAQVKRSEMGVANGVATLNSSGVVPTEQIPNSVKNIVTGYYNYNTSTNKGEFFSDSSKTQAVVGEDNKLYKDNTNNLVYVFDGNEFALLNGDYFAVTQTELNEILGIS